MTQRPIKFRAWDRTDKCLVNLEEISFDKDGSVYCVKHRGFSNTGGMYLYPGKTCDLMQFTGLTDKNGKEIYEGDIVQEDEELTTDVIEWDGAGWATRNWFESRELMQEAPLLEVIGNIYENPDLLAPKE